MYDTLLYNSILEPRNRFGTNLTIYDFSNFILFNAGQSFRFINANSLIEFSELFRKHNHFYTC